MNSQSDNYWLNLIHEIGPSLQKESKKLDEEYSFVYPRRKNEVTVPGPPFRPNSTPADICKSSAREGG